MAKTIKFIGITDLWYGNVITAAVTPTTLATWIGGATKVTNSHQDTFSYEQEDGEITDYVNELTGEVYFRDPTSQGARTISFTIGEYSFEDKAALQGGEVVKASSGGATIGWAAPEKLTIINKAIVGKTKTGNYVVFTNADITGKTSMAEKNMGLGITASALANPNTGVKSEYWFDGSAVTLPS